jgi:hypothetical protein
MCIFTGTIETVSDTCIYTAAQPGEHQALVYSMEIRTRSELAMVLPLPVPVGTGDDGIRFVSLEHYESFFDDLDGLFPALPDPRGDLLQELGEAVAADAPLEVHEVGAYDASFVPSHADWGRLDERFRLPPAVWEALPSYRDWGFAVFKLSASAAEKHSDEIERLSSLGSRELEEDELHEIRSQRVHPMALVFPTRRPERLFFPTVHVHDGEVHPAGDFFHRLYCQLEAPAAHAVETPHWRRSQGPVGAHVDLDRARGLVSAEAPLFRSALRGVLPNRDTWV